MIIRYPNYKLAAGWNNAGSLSSIESIIAIEGVFPAPYGTYNPGVRKIRGDGTLYIAGSPSCQWPFAVVPSYAKHKALMTTYCNGGYSGKVTVATRTDDSATYSNFNAIMTLPFLTEVRTEPGQYQDYIITFTRMVAI